MRTLDLDLKPFEIDSGDDEFSDEQTCGCAACNSEFELDELEAELDDLEWDEEIKHGRGSSRGSFGRRVRPAPRLRTWVKKKRLTKPRPLSPSRVRRPKPKPRPPKPKPWPTNPLKRPIFLRPKRRRPVVIREPAAPCICPAQGTEFVRWVQSSLNQVLGRRLRINGVMNRATRDALRDFQKQEGLPVDGIAGPETEKALVEAKTGQSNRPKSTPGESELFDDLELDLEEWEREVRVNRKSREYIRWIQRSLNKVLGTNLKVDGISGRQTLSAIRSFQKRFSLTVDGIVGRQTEAMLTMLGFSVPPATRIPSVPASGDWIMPPSVRAAGEAQRVRYDAPPPWAGKPGNCSESFTPGANQLKNFITYRHPGVSRIGGYNCRANSANRSQTSVHGVGRALDIMIPTVSGRANRAVGDPIANWLVENAETLGVQYIIWNRTKWSGSKTGRKHGRYGGPSPHIDHIHVELNRDGAARRTPWF